MASQSEHHDIKVLSWNIHGLKAKLKNEERKEKLLKIIDEYDVVLLQETRIGPKNENEDDTDIYIVAKAIQKTHRMEELRDEEHKERLDNQQKTMYLTYFSSRRRGVAIIINKPHNCLDAYRRGGDYAWVHVEIDGQKYTFMSVYYHRNETDGLMNEMTRFLTDGSEAFQKHLVIGGDFNTSLHPTLDAIRENRAHKPQRERLKRFMENGLLDVWRYKHDDERQYTFSTDDPRSRLDYIFMLKRELNDVRSCEIDIEMYLSDHFPVTLTLEMPAAVEDVTKRISKMDIKK